METNDRFRRAESQKGNPRRNSGSDEDAIAAGIGASAGVVIGSVAGTFAPEMINASEAKPDWEDNPAVESLADQNKSAATAHSVEPAHVEPVKADAVESKAAEDVPAETSNEAEQTEDDGVEVVGFERVEFQDGSQMDAAIVVDHGMMTGYFDTNLNGHADYVAYDRNNNQEFDADEFEPVTPGEDIAMNPYQEASGFDPLMAQNDQPDFQNNANVDDFMA